jgi:hypothetical protein
MENQHNPKPEKKTWSKPKIKDQLSIKATLAGMVSAGDDQGNRNMS